MAFRFLFSFMVFLVSQYSVAEPKGHCTFSNQCLTFHSTRLTSYQANPDRYRYLSEINPNNASDSLFIDIRKQPVPLNWYQHPLSTKQTSALKSIPKINLSLRSLNTKTIWKNKRIFIISDEKSLWLKESALTPLLLAGFKHVYLLLNEPIPNTVNTIDPITALHNSAFMNWSTIHLSSTTSSKKVLDHLLHHEMKTPNRVKRVLITANDPTLYNDVFDHRLLREFKDKVWFIKGGNQALDTQRQFYQYLKKQRLIKMNVLCAYKPPPTP
ncbi:hypothetical protein N9R79_11755 [Vibrio sp.]|nr:hypothetical protein [Vibrio sp.]